jgi:GNAT superfamily N-acetyltransferase
MKLKIAKLQLKDVLAASQLIGRSFSDAVAPTLTNEGVNTFMSGSTPESIEKRLASGNTFVVCMNEKTLVGVGEIRNQNHINLLFVEPSMQRNGIGRKLLHSLICETSKNNVTVNSSLNSVEAYKNFGFQKTGPESELKGIRYQPMVYELGKRT